MSIAPKFRLHCEDGPVKKWSNQREKKRRRRKSIVHSASNILMPLSVERDVWKWWSLCQLLDIRGVFNWGPSGAGRDMGDVERELAWLVLDEVGRPVVRQSSLSHTRAGQYDMKFISQCILNIDGNDIYHDFFFSHFNSNQSNVIKCRTDSGIVTICYLKLKL